MAQSGVGAREDPLERSAYRKVTQHIVPLVILAYTAAYLARVNIGLAKLQMLHDLGFSSAVYGFGAGIFFIGYFLFEVPSNLLLEKIGARLSIARIMILWGVVSAAMMLISSAWLFYLLRFLLGAAEAGFFPGVILYLTYWYPADRRARANALFMLSIPISGLIGNPVSGWILRQMEGIAGLAGWRWMFLLEALPSILIGIAVLFVMRDRIEDAEWLTAEEKTLLKAHIAEENATKACASPGQALRNGYLWLMCAIYFSMCSALYATGFWLPTFIKAAGAKSIIEIGWLSAIPYLFAGIAMIVLPPIADRTRQRRWWIAGPALVATAALAAAAQSGISLSLSVTLLTVGGTGILLILPLFWSLPAALVTGTAAAAGLAAINSLGNLSTFFSQPIMGWLSETSGNAALLYFMAGLTLAAAILTLLVPARLADK